MCTEEKVSRAKVPVSTDITDEYDLTAIAEDLHNQFCTECTDEKNCRYYTDNGEWKVTASQIVSLVLACKRDK